MTANTNVAALTKKELVDYIGPIFQELKTDIRNLDIKFTDKLNWQGTLMEDMRKEIRTALEASSSVLQEEGTVKEHEERITNLERDVKVLKAVKIPQTKN